MKLNLIKHFRLALAGLVLVASSGIASAQLTTNTTYSFDTVIPAWNNWYNQNAAFSWSTNDAATNAASGSLAIDFGLTTGDLLGTSQSIFFSNFANTWAGDPAFAGLDMNNYTTEEFDILVDPASTPNGAGNYGTIQVELFNSYSNTKIGEYTIPADAATNWHHVVITMPAGLGLWRGPCFLFQNWDGPTYPNNPGPVTYYIDNLTLVPKPPSPGISVQPVNQEIYAGGNVNWNVSASGGQPLSFQWYKGTTPLTDGLTGTGSGLVGSTNNLLTITNVTSADIGDYHLIVTNSIGSITSSVVHLSIVSPKGAYAIAVKALNPVAFYELNETNNPANGSGAYDHVGGFAGVYGPTVSNAFNGVVGPSLPGFAGNNGAASFLANSGAKITLPPLNLNTNTVTIACWVYPRSITSDGGIVFARNNGTTAGFCWAGTTGNLGYNWADNSATWGYNAGPALPLNRWSFAVLVITPDDATIYCMNNVSMTWGNNPVANVNQAFASSLLIGEDGLGANRTFDGNIDDVAIFNTSLTADQVQSLFFAGAGGPPLRFDGANLSWDDFSQNSPYAATSTTLLQQASSVTGPWTTVSGATSPWPVTPTGAQHYYRLKVQ